jgi:hypothetical protein
MVLNTGKQGSASPWRIKVTVEAEPEGGPDENMASPTVRHMERRTTTTVPLKDDDDSAPPKRRGRPRKSDTGTSASAKRNGTPKKVQPRKRRSSVGLAEAAVSDPPVDASPKKRRGRPRKSIQPEVEEAIGDDTAAAGPEIESTPPIAAPVIQTTSATPQETPLPRSILKGSSLMPPSGQGSAERRQSLLEYDEPLKVGTPPETELRKRIRARGGTPHSKVVAQLLDSSDEESDIDTPPATDEEASLADPVDRSSVDNTLAVEARLDALRKGAGADAAIEEATTYALDEGVTRMPDDTTIFESENFTMISVDSLRSINTPNDQQSSATPAADNAASTIDRSYLQIQAANSSTARRDIQQATAPSPANSQPSSAAARRAAARPALRRQITPAMNMRSPTEPPALERVPSPPKAESPEIGRVVKAGVALQGLVEPERVTPALLRERRESIDDLFRGFSDRTRKDLQAGLRLGQQLANEKDGKDNGQVSSQTQASPDRSRGNDMFSSPSKRRTRPLTPEEHDYRLGVPPAPTEAADVNYPSLQVSESEGHAASPVLSDDEMSGVTETRSVRAEDSQSAPMLTALNQQGEEIRGKDIYVETKTTNGARVVTATQGRQRITGEDILVVADDAQKTDYSDIWQEEASEGMPKPARGKLPRTWRRKSPTGFQYRDEGKEPAQQLTPPSSQKSGGPSPTNLDKGKGKVVEPTEPEGHSEASEDTGIFFLASKGSTINRRERGIRKTDELGVSLLLDDEQCLVPDSAPAPVGNAQVHIRAQKSSPPQMPAVEAPTFRIGLPKSSLPEKPDASLLLDHQESLSPEHSPTPTTRVAVNDKPHPFKDTPPRLSAVRTFPVKSSPLRQEVRASESEESIHRSTVVGESSLPVSSPFRTQVDSTTISTASDQRQFRQEMEGVTDSSVRNIRHAADAHADAYSSQYRTLHEIEEVTEQSRSVRSTFSLPSSPPKNMSWRQEDTYHSEKRGTSTFLDDGETFQPESSQSIDKSILKPRRVYSPLFGTDKQSASSKQDATRATLRTTREPLIAVAPRGREEAPTAPSTGLLSRLTSTLWAERSSASTPLTPVHPATAKIDPLPRVEPWTKTHYKTLDTLYQQYKKQPMLFSPSRSSPHAAANAALLASFESATEYTPFVGATYSCWGYSCTMTEELVVLCAAYMQLLTLRDVDEYERVSGKKIQMGDCGPGEEGTPIEGAEVVRRLATVIMGESLRRDERRGLRVSREGSMTVVWPAE